MHPTLFLAIALTGQLCHSGHCRQPALSAVPSHYYQVNLSPQPYNLASTDVNQIIRLRTELDRLEEALTQSTLQRIQRLQQQPQVQMRAPQLMKDCPPCPQEPNSPAPATGSKGMEPGNGTQTPTTGNTNLPVPVGIVEILKKYKCNECHVSKGHTQFFSGDSLNTLSTSKKREVMGWVVTGEMPPGKDTPKLTDEELAVISEWMRQQ